MTFTAKSELQKIYFRCLYDKIRAAVHEKISTEATFMVKFSS